MVPIAGSIGGCLYSLICLLFCPCRWWLSSCWRLRRSMLLGNTVVVFSFCCLWWWWWRWRWRRRRWWWWWWWCIGVVGGGCFVVDCWRWLHCWWLLLMLLLCWWLLIVVWFCFDLQNYCASYVHCCRCVYAYRWHGKELWVLIDNKQQCCMFSLLCCYSVN